MKPRVLEILRSYDDFEYEVIEEDVKKSGKMFLRGIFQKADTLNQNSRIYGHDVLSREVRNYQKLIVERRSTGELDHPSSSVVSLERVSHVVTDLHMDGNVVYGTLEVLDKLPMGRILRDLVESKIKIGISSRGVGSTEADGDYQIVQDDFALVSFDAVQDPSTLLAFLHENKRVVTRDEYKRVFGHADRVNRLLNRILDV